jgi:PiT family inorganic phosphate transporter
MEFTFIIIILAIVIALVFEFINGFHDCANSIATIVGTKVLSFKQAVALAAALNFVGALFVGGVAKMISTGLVTVILTPDLIMYALLSAIIWNLITWRLGLPSSSSHALVGGILGVAIAKYGFSVVNLANVGFKVLLPLVLSPLLGILIGYLILKLAQRYFPNFKYMNYLQILSASLMAFSHGTNDAQKTVGIIVMLMISGSFILPGVIPTWIVILCAVTMAAGTLAGGKRIIETMGYKITELKPIDGFAAETSASVVIQAATLLGAPISTTHVIASSIIGVGLKNGLNRKVVGHMLTAWFCTLPICILIGFLLVIIL